jgi:hypothetical protein
LCWKIFFKEGPAFIYSSIGIGIPQRRDKKSACVLMEDVGVLSENSLKIKKKVIKNVIGSVLEIGKNQKIKKNEIGCVLVAMPYFHLAKKAFTKKLTNQTLEEWKKEVKEYFLKKF